jgi:hypothetical protein
MLKSCKFIEEKWMDYLRITLLMVLIALRLSFSSLSVACEEKDENEIKHNNPRIINTIIDHSIDGWSLGFQRKFIDLAAHLNPYTIQGLNKIRLGNPFDGGYVVVDQLSHISAAYSLGIGDNVSWDLEIAKRGIPVFQYDNTVSGSPINHSLFKFYQLEVGSRYNLPKKITTIQNIMQEHGHQLDHNLILKIDIEGAEWKVFDSIDVKLLRNFQQIVCEFHDFSKVIHSEWYERAMRVFSKLTVYHRVVHVHANNWAPLLIVANVPFPDVLEVTFFRSDNHYFIESQETFPTQIDYPNNPKCADIFLGNFKFKL